MRKILIFLNVILTIGFICMAIYNYGIGHYVSFGVNVFCSVCWATCFVLNTKMEIDDIKERRKYW